MRANLVVLIAERTLQQAQLALADSTSAVSADLVVLYKALEALGGGWEAAAEGETTPNASAESHH